jgi:hypothetical protein
MSLDVNIADSTIGLRAPQDSTLQCSNITEGSPALTEVQCERSSRDFCGKTLELRNRAMLWRSVPATRQV